MVYSGYGYIIIKRARANLSFIKGHGLASFRLYVCSRWVPSTLSPWLYAGELVEGQRNKLHLIKRLVKYFGLYALPTEKYVIILTYP